MTQLVQAIYENGVFRPLEPVSLAEHERVSLVIYVASKNGSVNSEPHASDLHGGRYGIWADMSDDELAELQTILLSRSDSRENWARS